MSASTTISGLILVLKLTKIDDLSREDHCYLDPGDTCYFFGEYTSRMGYNFSETNNLISNFKKSVLKRGTHEWPHKQRAIDEVAGLYRQCISPHLVHQVTFVPAPPSKSQNDPEYDDRMVRALRAASPQFDVREIITQDGSRRPSHLCGDGERPRPADLIDCYRVNRALTVPVPRNIIICDDVLTNGTTFRAMKSVLQEQFPSAKIIGIFVARRVWNADLPAF